MRRALLLAVAALLVSPSWAAVTLINSCSDQTAAGCAAGAGTDRMAYLCLVSAEADGSSGEHAATAATLGGQSMTLVSTIKPPSPFREGQAIALFRLNEAGIAAMSGNAIDETWGDTNGEPTDPAYFVAYYGGVDQSTPNGTAVPAANDDTGISTWDPGDINGVVDGFIHACGVWGGGGSIAFDDLTLTQDESQTTAASVLETIATASTDAVDLAMTFSGTQRPKLAMAVTLNPAAGAGLTHIRTLNELAKTAGPHKSQTLGGVLDQ